MQQRAGTEPARTTLPGRAAALVDRVSGSGLLLGLLLFAASLTPSLIPRSAAMQGILGGAAFAVGYGAAVGTRALWHWLGLPSMSRRLRRWWSALATALGLAVAVYALSRANDWQNSIRTLMDLPPLETTRPLLVTGIALAVAAVLILVAWLFRRIVRGVSRRTTSVIPERVAIAVGLLVAFLVYATIVDGVLVRYGMRVVDASYARLDSLIEPGEAPPDDPRKSGSASSLVAWRDLGRAGRTFVSEAPSRQDIAVFWNGEAMEPVRVYVGLASEPSAEARAALALAEMERVGAFDRSVLVVAVPTGTGFLEEGAIGPLEYLHRGDVATVAMQYSYLQSPFSLLFEPGYGAETGRALMRAVYGRWTALPRDDRPRLYLQGLSLGALSSERSVRLHEVIGDPFQGALWSGPPFPSPIHASVTRERNPGSPAWLPVFEDGSFVRFMNAEGGLDLPGAVWGPMRIVYLQNSSDPIVFFSEDLFWRRPDWLRDPRGPDVSPAVTWYPVVSALQVAADMAVSTNVPYGHGHQYAPESYIEAWAALTEPDATEEDVARLKALFSSR